MGEQMSVVKPRILMFSQRNIHLKLHFRCLLYEFEDLICKMDSVDLIAPTLNISSCNIDRIAQGIAKHFALLINPGMDNVNINKDYDLFIAICQYPKDLLYVNSAIKWKGLCKSSVCWINEIWPSSYYFERAYLRLLHDFDHVIVNVCGVVKYLNDFLGKRCNYLPVGIDAVSFCPYPQSVMRVVDLYNMGRRSAKTHNALLEMARSGRLFYMYDSISGSIVKDYIEHRFLLASILKRSKYFIVNPGKIDSPFETAGESEIGARYFEGAASGSILIGEEPNNEEFKRVFDWQDFMFHMPYDSCNVHEIIQALENQSSRIESSRKNNVIGCLKKHDWAYRWEEILEMVGLDGTEGLRGRKESLKNLIKLIEKDVIPYSIEK